MTAASDEPEPIFDLEPASGPDPCRNGCLVGDVELSQWHLQALGVAEPLNGGGRTVAVIDSGIELDHPDLVGLVERPDCAPGRPIETDHGTSVAALITAWSDDGSGLAALVDDVRLLDIPVFSLVDGELIAGDAALSAAIRCAVAEGADVVNLSMASACSAMPLVESAIRDATDSGVVVVAAAGNHRSETLVCPAAFDEVIGVAAADRLGTPFTSLASADVIAPGRSLLTAGVLDGRPQTTRSGSSYATALVSAAAVALQNMHPEWTPARIGAHLHDLSPGLAAGGHLDLASLGSDRPGLHLLTSTGSVAVVGDTITLAGPDFVHPGAVAAARSCVGLWSTDGSGSVRTAGAADFFGDLEPFTLAAPVVAIAATRTGDGYWLAAADGGVFAFGDAGYFGSLGGTEVGSTVVDMVPSPSGRGYWLFTEDSRVFAFGDARYQGSIRAEVSGATAVADGYALIVDGGAITLPRVSYLRSAIDAEVIDVAQTAGDLWLVHSTGDVTNADGTATLVSPSPIVAVARPNQADDC